jgi:hypothetical protein
VFIPSRCINKIGTSESSGCNNNFCPGTSNYHDIKKNNGVKNHPFYVIFLIIMQCILCFYVYLNHRQKFYSHLTRSEHCHSTNQNMQHFQAN